MLESEHSTTHETDRVVRSYFGAMEAGDRGAQREWYGDDIVTRFPGDPPRDRDESVAYFDDLYAAVPDFRFELLDTYSDGDRATVNWRISGTFAGPGTLFGFEPNGAALRFEGVDLVRVRGGRVSEITAYFDGMEVARQLGVMPPDGAPLQQRMVKAANAGTKLRAKLLRWSGPEEIADGVWRVQGDPGRCSVYFLRDGDGVTMFDAGARVMLPFVRGAAARLGGLTRIVLGHGHTDHRGTAPGLGAPVFCHPDEVVDAEGSGGFRYFEPGLRHLPIPLRQVHKAFHPMVWDGGPVEIAGTVSEGDEVAGFEVVHTPGHAPGLITLWRASDGVALVSDLVYTSDMWGRDSAAHLPMDGYNLDTAQAAASARKVAALSPTVVWAGHAHPIRGDVRGALERAADG